MNKTFKVASNALRGTVVCSEKASSYQGRAIKTVIAAAVASMVAGAAMAAEPPTLTLTGATLTVTGDAAAKQSVGQEGTASITPKVDERAVWKNGEDTLGADRAVTLTSGGAFVVKYDTTGTSPDLKYAGVSTTIGSLTSKTADTNVTLTSRGVAGAADKTDAVANLKVNGKVDFAQGGTLSFVTDNAENKSANASTLEGTDIIFGTANSHRLTGVQAKITADANSNAAITGTTVKLDNVAIANEGKLAISSSSTLDVGQDSTVANSKVLTLTADQGLTFNADYADAGILSLTSTKAAVTLGGNIKVKEAKFGVAYDPKSTTETATFFANGADGQGVFVDAGSVQEFEKLTVEGTVTVSGTDADRATNDEYEAGALKVTNLVAGDAAKNATISNESGSVELGTVTVNSGKKLTVANGTHDTLAKDGVKNVFTAEKLVVAANSTTPTALEAGLFVVDSGSFTLTGTGSTNAGQITLGSAVDAELVVAEGADLTNSAKIGDAAAKQGTLTVLGTVKNSGTAKNAAITAQNITVAGTLTNEYVNDTQAPSSNVFAQINAEKLTVKKGGTVSAALYKETAGAGFTTYAVTTTTVEEGGTFLTTLNAKTGTAASDPDNALTLNGNEFILDGGKLATKDGDIQNFVLNTGDKLTLNGTYDLNEVQVKEATAAFTAGEESVVSVKTLNVTAGSANVGEDGHLTVTDSFKTADGAVSVNVGDFATLTTSLAAMNLKTDATGTVGDLDSANNKTQSVKNGTIQLNRTAILEVTGIDTIAAGAAGTQKLAQLLSDAEKTTSGMGLIDLGSAKISGLTTTNGKITALAYNNIAGITAGGITAGVTNDEIDALVVTDLNEQGGTASYGAAELAGDRTVLSLQKDTVLYLHNSGNLVSTSTGALGGVTFQDAGYLITTGAGAKVGAVTGESGNVFVDSGDLTIVGNTNVGSVEVAKDAALKMEQASGATDPVTLTAHTAFDVAGTLTTAGEVVLDISHVSDDNYAEVAGTLNAGKLTIRGDEALVVSGTVVAGELAGTGSVEVGDMDPYAGTKTREEARDYEWARGTSKVAFGKVADTASINVVENSIVALGTTDVAVAEKAFAATGLKLSRTAVTANSAVTGTVNRVVYVEGNKDAAVSGNVKTMFESAYADTRFGAQDALVFDAQKVDSTGDIALLKNNVSFNGQQPTDVLSYELDEGAGTVVAILNAKNGDKYRISAGSVSGLDGVNSVFTGDLMMDAVASDDGSTLQIQMEDKADLAKYGMTGAAFDAAYDFYRTGSNVGNTSSSAQFQNFMFSKQTSPFYDAAKDDVNVVAMMTALNSAAALGATTGVQAMTMDAVEQMADTVATRNSILTQRAQGVNVWADVNGGKFEAKKLFEGAGYSSDIYAGVLGLDYQFSCNAVLGAALTIGTADTDSKNSAFGASTDTDLVGFSVYASKTFADIWNVAADIGYMSASNDVKANGYGFNYKFSQDTDAFTVGVRGEVLTKAGAVNIVPHVGLRYTQLSTDGFEAAYVTDVDDQNVFQMPVGITVSGDFETNGWTLAPKFDLSVVPTFGDKDADLKLGINGSAASSDYAVRVLDSNPVQATLGINATNGAWGFGLSYKLGVGSDERQDNSFNAQVRYAF